MDDDQKLQMLVDAYQVFKDDPTNRNKLMWLANCARISAGYPMPGTTCKALKERSPE